MKKDLFYILQELKRDINKIDLEYYDKQLEELEIELKENEQLYNKMNKAMIYEDIKVILLNIITFGIYYKRYEYEYQLRKELIDGTLSDIQHDIKYIVSEMIAYEVLKDINSAKKESFIKNRDQIDKFLTLYEKLKDEEKTKLLNYKIGNIYE